MEFEAAGEGQIETLDGFWPSKLRELIRNVSLKRS